MDSFRYWQHDHVIWWGKIRSHLVLLPLSARSHDIIIRPRNSAGFDTLEKRTKAGVEINQGRAAQQRRGSYKV